ncbi:MAG: hypothetical protein ACO2ZM_07970, partial [Francisellaceae bacterium]
MLKFKRFQIFIGIAFFYPIAGLCASDDCVCYNNECDYQLTVSSASGIDSALSSTVNDDNPMLYTNGKDQWPFKLSVTAAGYNPDTWAYCVVSLPLNKDDVTADFSYPTAVNSELLEKDGVSLISDVNDITGTDGQLVNNEAEADKRDTNYSDYLVSTVASEDAVTGYYYSPSLSTTSTAYVQGVAQAVKKDDDDSSDGLMVYINADNPDNYLSLGYYMDVTFHVNTEDTDGNAVSLDSGDVKVNLSPPTVYDLDDLRVENTGLSYPFNGQSIVATDVSSPDYPHNKISQFQLYLPNEPAATVDISKTFSAMSCDSTTSGYVETSYGGYCVDGSEIHVVGKNNYPYPTLRDMESGTRGRVDPGSL